jgi:CubicO group peptidase (beta-lactamase class C family)
MRRFFTIVGLAGLLAGLAFAGDGAAPAARLDAVAVDAAVHEALKSWDVPGAAVAIVRDDQVVYLKGYGVREVGREEKVTPDTVFPIASCTKAFTTTAMAMLVDEGKMAWDDPPRKYVPYFRLSDPLVDANVTLRDLVTHRTGVRSHDLLWYRSPWTQEEIIRKIGRVKVELPFRTAFRYQSTMFTTAGHAVAAASGTSWADFVQKRILDPLEMKNTTLTTTAVERMPDRASPHRKDASGRPQAINWYPLEVPEPAGSVNSTARDLANWVRFHLSDGVFAGKRLVSAASLGETHTPQIALPVEGTARAMNPDTLQMSYGMAWLIYDYRGRLVLTHAGLIDGFRAQILFVPREKLGLVMLCNLDQTLMNVALGNNLLDLLLGLDKKDWNRIEGDVARSEREAAEARAKEREEKQQHSTKPSREPGAYVGDYEEPAYGTATVRLEQGVLVWRWSTFRGPLEHYHYDTFTLRAGSIVGTPPVTFILGDDGNVQTMRVGGAVDVEFKKVRKK